MAEKTLLEIIREKHAQLKAGDYFALLDLTREADSGAIRNAYFTLAKKLHPDIVARQKLKEVEREALEVFKGISEAYTILSDRNRRAEYEARLTDGTTGSPAQKKSQRDMQSEARIFFHKGNLMAQRRAWAEAELCYRKAVELDPKCSRYLLNLGWALMQNSEIAAGRRMEEAKEWFRAALDMAGNEPDPHYYMAMYYKAMGETDQQRRSLQDALTINPKHVDAMREARLLNMRESRKRSDFPFAAQIQNLMSKFTPKKK